MHDDLLEKLMKIGLSEIEAKLYVLSLRLGPSSIIKIGQKLGVTRQRVYAILPKLAERGLISQITIGARQYYQATDPDVLVDIAEQSRSQMVESLPVLKSMQATNLAVPLITVYENPLSMREWYRKFLKEAKAGEEMLIWSSSSGWIGMDEEFYQNYIIEKGKTGVIDRVITSDTMEARCYMKKMAKLNGEWRFCKNHWNKKAEIWIWRDEICYQTLRENATNLIVIKSADLATIERFNFENSWKACR